jgi:SAM-dependent MidA family methyltransferase
LLPPEKRTVAIYNPSMRSPLHAIIVARIRNRGPITMAEYMELALYHPEHGYYCSASRRSGRSGDFITSVDVGPLFGELVATQLAECWDILRERGAEWFDLVEAGAGNGQLTRDILDAAEREFPNFYRAIRVTLVERSPAAARAHAAMLGAHRCRMRSATELPRGITGAIVANELLDAMPVHLVVVRGGELREAHVSEQNGELIVVELPVSSARVSALARRLCVGADEGAYLEVSLAAADWIAAAAASIERGFLLLFDYGREPDDPERGTGGRGTLAAYRAHVMHQDGWLNRPGEMDLTAHVNLTLLRDLARAEGLTPVGAVDQTYFLTGAGLADRLPSGSSLDAIRRRLAARTLMMPGGLGSTIKAMLFAKGAGTPALSGFSAGRLTR